MRFNSAQPLSQHPLNDKELRFALYAMPGYGYPRGGTQQDGGRDFRRLVGDLDHNGGGTVPTLKGTTRHGGWRHFNNASTGYLVSDSAQAWTDFSDRDVMTVSAWVSFTTSQSNVAVVSRWDSGTDWIHIIDPSANKLAFYIQQTGANKNATSTNTYNDGAWYHFIGVADGANVLLRVFDDKGKLLEDVTGTAYTGNIDGDATSMQVGRGGGGNYAGDFDAIRVYGRAFTLQECKFLNWCDRQQFNPTLRWVQPLMVNEAAAPGGGSPGGGGGGGRGKGGRGNGKNSGGGQNRGRRGVMVPHDELKYGGMLTP